MGASKLICNWSYSERCPWGAHRRRNLSKRLHQNSSQFVITSTIFSQCRHSYSLSFLLFIYLVKIMIWIYLAVSITQKEINFPDEENQIIFKYLIVHNSNGIGI
jgi:hypothetical protein